MGDPVYVHLADGVWARREYAPHVGEVDAVVFDVDGVLVDTRDSYPRVIAEVTQFFFEHILAWPGRSILIAPEETSLFKQAGGFNSDWGLTAAVILVYLWKAEQHKTRDLQALRAAPPDLAALTAAVRERGGGMAALESIVFGELGREAAARVRSLWDRELIERLCCEFYGGDDWCEVMFGFRPVYRVGPGLFNNERPLVRRPDLEGRVRRYGVYTGRVLNETLPALRLCGIEDLIDRGGLVTGDTPYRKPDPGGLRVAFRGLGARRPLYVGDNVDDWRTVVRYRELGPEAGPPALFAGLLSGALRERSRSIFEGFGVDIVATDVRALLQYVNRRG